jgi:hypothetical protein
MKIARLLTILAATTVTLRAAQIESIEAAAAKPALQKLDAFLNEQSVATQLADLGLTPEQAQARLAQLDDAQLTRLAAETTALQAGGDITSGTPRPLGPIGCIFKRIGDTIKHVFQVLFCWTDIP